LSSLVENGEIKRGHRNGRPVMETSLPLLNLLFNRFVSEIKPCLLKTLQLFPRTHTSDQIFSARIIGSPR
jgi:hypothetical protein